MTKRKREDPPRRQRNARADASVGSIEQDIANTYGLPRESVQINNPNGGNARSDKRIGSLRRDFEKNRR